MLESCILQIIVHTYRDLSNYRARSYTNTLELHASNPLAYEICNYIDTNLTDIKKLSDVSQALGYSYAYLSKIFSQSMNLSIKDYYTQRRFETAAKMLAQDFTIARISQVLHFSDDSSFCQAFKYNTSQIPGASVRQLRPALHLASFPICSLYLDPDTRLAGGFQTGFPDCHDPDRLRIRHRSVFIFVICYLVDQLL